jgi:hypothetical protein
MNLQDQVEIVKQRLHYHFLQIDGSWDVPKGLPFMKEFLNEIRTLCKLVETQLPPKQD